MLTKEGLQMTLKELFILKKRPDLHKEFVNSDTQNINNDFKNLKEVYLWKCRHGHTWYASLKKRIAGRGCQVCCGRVVVKGINDLASKHPFLLYEWDYEKNKDVSPENISAGSGKKVWWKCAQGHSWQDTVNHRADGRGCPYCGNKKIIEGENDLASTHPQLLKEWDYDKNIIKPTQVVAGSSKKVKWICSDCGHQFEASVINRTRFKMRCPKCKNKK